MPASSRLSNWTSFGGAALALCLDLGLSAVAGGFVGDRPCSGPTDDIHYGTCGYAPDPGNYGRVFPNYTIATSGARPALVVTAIPALAGAVASIKYNGQELIATGGHGASFQYALHPSYPSRGLAASECDNPTEAGSKPDDAAAPGAPWLSQSTSGIIGIWSTPASPSPQIATKVNLAYYVPAGTASDFNGNCAAYTVARGGFVDGKVSSFILDKWITLGATFNGTFFPNVIRFDARIEIPRDTEQMDVTLVAYLSRLFQDEIFFDPRTNTQVVKVRGQALQSGFVNISTAPVTRIFADRSWRTAVGVLAPPSALGARETRAPLLYTATNADFSASNYSFVFRNVASQHYFSGLSRGESVETHSYFVVGSVAEVKAAAKAFCKQWRSCS
jgi:hypothetical protein